MGTSASTEERDGRSVIPRHLKLILLALVLAASVAGATLALPRMALPLAAQSADKVLAWGANFSGQLGDGTADNSSNPVQVEGLSGVVAIAGGAFQSLALTASGHVWAWGDNAFGQLGDGNSGAGANSSHPVQVQGLSGVAAIAGGGDHSLALTTSGKVWAWGYNAFGQLGDGTSGAGANSSRPVEVKNLSGVVAIAGGGNHSLALTRSGDVWAWGHNRFGQLGNGTTTDTSTPVRANNLSGVVAIAAGGAHSLALTGSGQVWAWGDNFYGQLGDGTATDSSTPIRVNNLSGVVAIAGGGPNSLALTASGRVWAWGDNAFGQLGDGSSGAGADSSSPVQVQGLSGVVAIAGGDAHSLALTRNGQVWAWGYNFYGQLGDGKSGVGSSSATPVEVPIPPGDPVTAIAAGGYHSLGLNESIQPTTPTTSPIPTPAPVPTPTPAPVPTPTATALPSLPGLPNTGARPRQATPDTAQQQDFV